MAKRLVMRCIDSSDESVKQWVMDRLDEMVMTPRDEHYRDLFFDLYDVIEQRRLSARTDAHSHEAMT